METKYYTPTIDSLHIGFECEKQTQELIANELNNKIELKLIANIDYEMQRDLTFAPHIITANDIQMYSLNPHL